MNTVLEGDWQVTQAVHGGQEMDKSQVGQLQFHGNEFKSAGGHPIGPIKFVVDQDPTPYHIDIYAEGDDHPDKKTSGIVKIEGDVLHVCHNDPGEDRPDQFVSQEGTHTMLTVSKKK